MDDGTISALRGFDDIWARVSGASEGGAPSLGALAEAAARQCELLTALSRRCPAQAARLRGMAAAERALICRLRAERFLASGEDCRPSAACAVVNNALCALREAQLGASSLAEGLQAAANAAPCELRRSLDALAAGERCRARELRELILCCFGANCS